MPQKKKIARLCYCENVKVKKTGPDIEPVKALVQRFRGPTGLTGGWTEV